MSDVLEQEVEFPMFVTSEEDKVRWKASLDLATLTYNLTYPKDTDFQQVQARFAYDSDFTTNELRGAAPDTPPREVDPQIIPARFDFDHEEDPMVLRAAVKTAGKLKWVEDPTGTWGTEINGVLVRVDGAEKPAATVATRLAYLLSPLPSAAGDGLTVRLNRGSHPDDDQDNPAMVTATPGEVNFWQTGDEAAKISEAVFDFVVARALRADLDEPKYLDVQQADARASQEAAQKWQKKWHQSLPAELEPRFLLGSTELSVYSRGRSPEDDFNESFAWWLGATRCGYLVGKVRFKDVYPNRDRMFSQWS